MITYRGYDTIIVPRKTDPNSCLVLPVDDQSCHWALKDRMTDKIVLKSDLFQSTEAATEAATKFMKRLMVEFPTEQIS